MMGVDTNVLVRYYIDDDSSQHQIASDFVTTNEIYVSLIVLVESFWVMSRVYEVEKTGLIAIFEHLSKLSNVTIEQKTVFVRALDAYQRSSCDFTDALIFYLSEVQSFKVVTFDKNASKKLGMILLK